MLEEPSSTIYVINFVYFLSWFEFFLWHKGFWAFVWLGEIMFKYFKIGVAIFFWWLLHWFPCFVVERRLLVIIWNKFDSVECGLGNHRCLCQKKDAKKIHLNIGIFSFFFISMIKLGFQLRWVQSTQHTPNLRFGLSFLGWVWVKFEWIRITLELEKYLMLGLTWVECLDNSLELKPHYHLCIILKLYYLLYIYIYF